jgi:hypothetical protein
MSMLADRIEHRQPLVVGDKTTGTIIVCNVPTGVTASQMALDYMAILGPTSGAIALCGFVLGTQDHQQRISLQSQMTYHADMIGGRWLPNLS